MEMISIRENNKLRKYNKLLTQKDNNIKLRFG